MSIEKGSTNQLTQHKPEVRVHHEIFYQYQDFLKDIKNGFPDTPRFYVDSSIFKNASHWLKVIVGKKGRQSELEKLPRYQAVVPFWLSTQFGYDADVRQAVEQVISSLMHSERGRLPLVDEVLGIAPYIEMRQDKDGSGDDGDRSVGESIDAELVARSLNRLKKLLVLGPHSAEGINYLKREGIDVLSMTAAPIFAEHVRKTLFARPGSTQEKLPKNRILPENTRIVSLDKGCLQQCLHFSQLLGLDPADHLVVFDKKRKGHNMVADSALIYGNPKDLEGRDVIIYDDIIDTFDSMGKTLKSLREIYKCRSITVIATHGVLSYPARQNIIDALEKNEKGHRIVDRVIMSDTLPKARYAFEGISGVTIKSIGKYIGRMAHLFADCSYEDLMHDSYLSQFILDPIDKESVWQQFVAYKADPQLLQQTEIKKDN